MGDTKVCSEKPRRKAQFITPLNLLKAKVGFGGLSEEIINRAEAVLANNAVDFRPMATLYLAALRRGIENAGRRPRGTERNPAINGILYPAMQLKANGGMFGYPLVTHIAERLIEFFEAISVPGRDAIEIALAFHTTLQAVVAGRMTGSGGRKGEELLAALEAACRRYFNEHRGTAGAGIGHGSE